jgi:uncharacterized protein (DUF433 family)
VSSERNADILRRRLAGETLKEIAADYGVSPSAVRNIVDRMVLQATTTEAEREARKRAKREEAKRREQEAYARAMREREEAERQRWLNTFNGQVATVQPDWSSINNFGWWLRERIGRRPLGRTVIRAASYPLVYDDADKVLESWLDGRANDHMTVLRLRKLTEVAA